MCTHENALEHLPAPSHIYIYVYVHTHILYASAYGMCNAVVYTPMIKYVPIFTGSVLCLQLVKLPTLAIIIIINNNIYRIVHFSVLGTEGKNCHRHFYPAVHRLVYRPQTDGWRIRFKNNYALLLPTQSLFFLLFAVFFSSVINSRPSIRSCFHNNIRNQ